MKHAFTFLIVLSLLGAAAATRAEDKSSGGNDIVRFLESDGTRP